ncbi:MAG: hypothetical protein ABII68_11945 [Pseudomonadota bacterium]
MKDLFKDILEINDVKGVLFVSVDGKILFKGSESYLPEGLEEVNWSDFIRSMEKVEEADLVFENSRFYVRRTETGYIFVMMGRRALVEMVRLNCNILLPSFEQIKKKSKGLSHLFKFK